MAKRALVLGGGGVVGIAWESGIMQGLQNTGVDPADADLIIGTSAGSVVGAQIAMGMPVAGLVQAQSRPGDGSIEGAMGQVDQQVLTAVFTKWAGSPEATPPVRAEIGAMALASRTASEEEFIAAIRSLLGTEDWPQKALVLTAVDAQSGEFVTWDRTTGVSLTLAVASSCAVPGLFPPITINGLRYMDGGVRSGTSADLARDCDVVLVVAPIGASDQGIGGIARRQLDAEVAELRQAGKAVEVVLPDPAAMQAFGPNLMDQSRRQPAVEAGLRQGEAIGRVLSGIWAGAKV